MQQPTDDNFYLGLNRGVAATETNVARYIRARARNTPTSTDAGMAIRLELFELADTVEQGRYLTEKPDAVRKETDPD